jgi:very-short-patch-repair endonuclease
VTATGDRHDQKGIRVHRARELHPHDHTRRDGIAVTSVPRTLLDLATVATPKLLARAVNEADRQGRLNRRAARELLDRNKGRRGVKRLRAVIAAVSPGTRRTRSDFETAFLDRCRKHRIELPQVNTKVEGYDVDMHWPGTKLIVELDHYEYHRTPAEFTNDRRRDAYLKTKGYTVLRISDEWFDNDPNGVAETVKALLSSAQAAAPRSPSAPAAAPRP